MLAQVAELGPLDVLVHNAATGVVRPALETDGQALGLDARRQRPRAALAGAHRGAVDAARIVDRRDLLARLAARARELRADRHLEGGARGARPLPRGRAGAPRGIRVNAVSAGVVETGALDHFPNREEMLERGAREPGRAAGRARGRRRARSPSSARPAAEMIRGHVLVVDGGFLLGA